MGEIFGFIAKDQRNKDLICKTSFANAHFPSTIRLSVGPALFGVTKKPFRTEKQDEFFSNPDKNIHVLISGEITNRKELININRERLNQSSGDAEIIASLFEEHGSECFKKIDGHFCSSVWLRNEKRLHLFLDRIGGIRNVWYAKTNNGFAFSSNIHRILAICGVKREINTHALVSLFKTGHILPPQSLLKGICKMRPGEEVVYEDGRLRARVLLRIEFISDNGRNCDKDEFREALTRTVANLSEEKEVAFLLSGGVDSSILVALASQDIGRKIWAFTASFPGSDLDERIFAESVARHYDCEHEVVEMRDARAIDSLPEIVWHLDEPLLDYSAVPVYHLFKEIRRKTSIVISGDGPDHLFGRYYPLAAKICVSNKLGFANRLLEKIPVAFLNKVARTSNLTPEEAYNEIFILPNWGLKNAGNVMNIFSDDISEVSDLHPTFSDLRGYDDYSFKGIFDVLSYVDFYVDGSFGVFSKVGKMAAAHNLMIREPYLQREVSDIIAGLPLICKVRGSWLDFLLSKGKGKYLLKHRIGEGLIPAEIVDKKKGGFTPPLGKWLKDKICDLPLERLFSDTVLTDGYFNVAHIKKILSDHANGRQDWSTIIFMILSFDIFARMVLENRHDSFPGWTLNEIYL